MRTYFCVKRMYPKIYFQILKNIFKFLYVASLSLNVGDTILKFRELRILKINESKINRASSPNFFII